MTTNGYVRRHECDAKHDNTTRDMAEVKCELKEIRTEIKELNDRTYKLMIAIGIILTTLNVGGNYLIKLIIG